MTARPAQRALRLAVAAALALVGVLVLGSPAHAETKVVTLGQQGPSPAVLDVKVGDVVRFSNTDSVAHTITRTSGPWTFSVTIAAGASATTKAFTTACSCGYSDQHTVVVVPQTDTGTIRVTTAAPSPSPTARPTSGPTPGPTPRPTPRPSRSPSARPSPSSSPTPAPTQSGVALGPGLVPGAPPTGGPTPAPATPGPRPDLAGPSPSVAPAGGPAYAGKDSLVQGSPHRYGLPAALAVVAVVGVVSLLVRLLLAQPEAKPQG